MSSNQISGNTRVEDNIDVPQLDILCQYEQNCYLASDEKCLVQENLVMRFCQASKIRVTNSALKMGLSHV